MSGGGDMLGAALDYASRGIPVFPCSPLDKKPLTKHGFRDATTAEATIRGWWRTYQKAMIGAPTGERSGFVVVDLDVDPEKGVDGRQAWRALVGDEADPDAWIATTPRGGAHEYYRWPGHHVPNSAGRLGRGIDVRGDGGYVILPPSRRKDGVAYEWQCGGSGTPPPLPPGLEYVPAPQPEAPRLAVGDDARASEWALKAFDDEIGRVARAGEGTRNDTLNRAALSLAQIVAGGHLDRVRVEAALTAAAIGAGLGGKEIRATIASAFRAGLQQPRGPAERPDRPRPRLAAMDGAPVPDDRPEPPPDEPAQPAALPLVWFHQLEPTLDTADFVQGVLGNGAFSVVYGESGCGKTFFTGDLALHVAFGWPWFGRAVEQGGVIYVACEGSHSFRNRISAFRLKHGLEGERPPFAAVLSTVNLLDPEADAPRLIETIKAAAEEIIHPVRLVVIDTLSRALAGGNENSPEDMGALVRNADLVRQATGAHLLFVHHSGKNAALGARGHSLLRAATDTEIEVAKDEFGGGVTATVTKQRELETSGQFHFELRRTELGLNPRGEPVTSCVVIERQPGEAADAAERARRKLSADSRQLLQEVRELMGRVGRQRAPEPGMAPVPTVTRRELRDWCVTRGWLAVDPGEPVPDKERQRLSRSLRDLREAGLAGIYGEAVWLVEVPL